MRRVAITTDHFDSVSSHFSRLGMDPIAMPCIRVEQMSDEVLSAARDAASRADLLIIGSARTISILWPGRPMPDVDVAAVGEKTARSARRLGGRVVVTGRLGLLGLVELARPQLNGADIVFPHAAGSDPEGLDALRTATKNLDEFEIYRSVPIAPGQEDVDAVSFASPSAVEGWHLTRDLNSIIVGVIGSTTARAVRPYRKPDVMAARPSHRALAEAIATHVEVPV